MSGNVWNGYGIRFGDYSSGSQTDPTGPDSGTFRVFRGGCWTTSLGALACRTATSTSTPRTAATDLGFRLFETYPLSAQSEGRSASIHVYPFTPKKILFFEDASHRRTNAKQGGRQGDARKIAAADGVIRIGDSGLCLMCKGICRLWVPRDPRPHWRWCRVSIRSLTHYVGYAGESIALRQVCTVTGSDTGLERVPTRWYSRFPVRVPENVGTVYRTIFGPCPSSGTGFQVWLFIRNLNPAGFVSRSLARWTPVRCAVCSMLRPIWRKFR